MYESAGPPSCSTCALHGSVYLYVWRCLHVTADGLWDIGKAKAQMPAMWMQAALADSQRRNSTLAEDNAAKAAKVRELEGHLIALARVRRADKLPRAVSDAIRHAMPCSCIRHFESLHEFGE